MKRRTFLKTLGILAGGLTFSPLDTIAALFKGKRFVDVPLDHQLCVTMEAPIPFDKMPKKELQNRYLKPAIHALNNQIKHDKLIRIGKFRVIKGYNIYYDSHRLRIDAFCVKAKYLK